MNETERAKLKAAATSAGITDKPHADQAAAFAVKDRMVPRETIAGPDIAAAIVREDLAGLNDTDRLYLQLLVAAGVMPLNATLKGELKELFPKDTPTRANLAELFRRPGTLAEEIGIPQPTPSDIAEAMKG